MNEGGYSWLEAILALTIAIVIFGTLLPFATMVTSDLQERKLHMYAAETALQGSIYFSSHGLMEGIRQVDGVDYNWNINGEVVCVSYEIVDKVFNKCVK
ncbi:MAG: hypothetical protein ABS920_03425 [Sporosarcina sp.]